MRPPSVAVLLILGLVLGGCAAPSAVLRQAPAQAISLAEARTDAESHQGAAVRWGGMLLSTASEPAATWLEILEYPLNEDGRPQATRTAGGRFLARTGESLNTAAYPPGSLITVAGTLAGTVHGAVGRSRYAYPLVDMTEHFVWQRYDYDPYGYEQKPGDDYHYLRDRPSLDYEPGHYRPGVRRLDEDRLQLEFGSVPEDRTEDR